MERYSNAKNFFEINMIKDFASKKMQTITDKEAKFLKRIITDCNANILDVMCGYGRLANRMTDLGFNNISGVDVGNFDFICEQKKFKFYNADFYDWLSSSIYDYCYSLYNSYSNYEMFLKTIEKCRTMLKNNGVLIIDIFNKAWRDRIPDSSYRLITDNGAEKVELFRQYDGLYEQSVYKISDKLGSREYTFSQCVISKEKLLELIPDDWDVALSDSMIENTRDDDQKNILILRKKVKK